jgi:SAM-dependent methyltransferase
MRRVQAPNKSSLLGWNVLGELARLACALCAFIVYQRVMTQPSTPGSMPSPAHTPLQQQHQQQRPESSTHAQPSSSSSSSSHPGIWAGERDFWALPAPPNLPSSIVDRTSALNGSIYGGKLDKPHLGGFTKLDIEGLSPNVFNFMMGIVGIKSFLDVGCGRGHSTKYFLGKKARVLCVEGSKDAVQQSVLPRHLVVEHDFTRGPWWPGDTFDACWSVEFLEHVSRHYAKNYITAFRKCAILFVTRSPWGGYHHVEVHEEWWWIARLQSAGFIHDEGLSKVIQKQVRGLDALVFKRYPFTPPPSLTIP